MAAQLSPQALDQVGMQGESVFGGVVDGRTCVFASAWHAHRGGGGGG